MMLRAATPLAYNFVLLLKMDVSGTCTVRRVRIALHCASCIIFLTEHGSLLLRLFFQSQATALLKFIGKIDVIPFFGGSFTQVFPWFIFVIALMTVLNVWSVLARLLNMERFQYIAHAAPDNEAHQEMRDAIAEGKKLIEIDVRNQMRQKELLASSQRLDSGTAVMLTEI
jgi:hypothetical protein